MTPHAKNLLGIPEEVRVYPKRLIRNITLIKYFFRKWKFQADSIPEDEWVLFPERGSVNNR